MEPTAGFAADEKMAVEPKGSDQYGPEPGLEKKGRHNVYDDAESEILHGHLTELEVDLARVIAEDDTEGDWEADTSPFPAVRAVVPETDDTEMPVNTFRAWFLGIVSVLITHSQVDKLRDGRATNISICT